MGRTVLSSILFVDPEWILLVLPLLALLIYQASSRRKADAVAIAGLEYLQTRNSLEGAWRKHLRAILRLTMVIGLGVLWANPWYRSAEPLLKQQDGSYHKNFVIALDMSPSMNLPADFKGYAGEDLKFGAEGVTRFEMARDAMLEFLERFRGERFGLILFSTEPLLARWPTVETGANFAEVLESIRRGSGTQLEAFSSLTNVDKALEMARRALGRRHGAIILISDAEDDLESLGEAVRDIRRADIRLYTIGVGVPDDVAQQLAREFEDDPGFRLFRVDSQEEMREAYRLVAAVEESPRFAGEKRIFQSSLRWMFSILLLGITMTALCITEVIFPRSVASPGALALKKGLYGL